MDNQTADIQDASDRLIDRLRDLQSCVIAYSGGVDSSVVAKAATIALPQRCLAVFSASASVSQHDIQIAQQTAASIQIECVVIDSREIENSNYVQNDNQRCYFCKSSLYRSIEQIRVQRGMKHIVSGTNADDLGDYRPGLKAAAEFSVVAPLAELKFDKSTVRALGRLWQLDVAERPASPCLASRIAYGIRVELPRLRRIELAEAWLRERGYSDSRVRVHADELARVELTEDELSQFFSTEDYAAMNLYFKSIGFRFATIDLAGLRSGSLNFHTTHFVE